jgi:hypothetical protein
MHSLVFFLGLLWGAVGATAAERYVVVESRPLTLRAEERAQVFRAIADGLRATGREVAGTQVDGECTTPACWMDAAAAAKATDILVVAGSSERFGWTISLEHRNAAGSLVCRSSYDCKSCPFVPVIDGARLVVQKMLNLAPAEKYVATKMPPLPAIPPRAPPVVAALLDDAEKSFRENRIEEAVKSARAAVRAGGGTRARLVEGRILFGAERLEESEAAFAAILQLTPDNEEAAMWLEKLRAR